MRSYFTWTFPTAIRWMAPIAGIGASRLAVGDVADPQGIELKEGVT